MRHQTSNKHLFQRTLFTLFSSLLFVGTMYVSGAQAEDLTGPAKGTQFCEDPNAIDPGVADKGKFEGIFNINVNIGGLPVIGGSVSSSSPDFFVSGPGLAFSKNTKKGSFTWTGTNIGSQILTLSGNYKTDKNTGEVVLLKGKFVLEDNNTTCIATGKFKAKTDPNPPTIPMPG